MSALAFRGERSSAGTVEAGRIMKRALKISVSANVVLFALVLSLMRHASLQSGLPLQDTASSPASEEPTAPVQSSLSELQSSQIEPTWGSQSSDEGASLPHIANNRALDRIILMPLVFQNVSTTAMELDSRQMQVI